ITAANSGREHDLVLKAGHTIGQKHVTTSHDDVELAFLSACVRSRSDHADFAQLLRCARAKNATVGHRMRASVWLVFAAYDRQDSSLARLTYAGVEDLLDASCHDPGVLEFLGIFHSAFGDIERSVPAATALARYAETVPPAQ